jgi:uncharacterized membrane protein
MKNLELFRKSRMGCCFGALALLFSGCDTTESTLGGGAGGAVAGALLGSTISGSKGAAVGAVIGGLGGAAVGHHVGAENERKEAMARSRSANYDIQAQQEAAVLAAAREKVEYEQLLEAQKRREERQLNEEIRRKRLENESLRLDQERVNMLRH